MLQDILLGKQPMETERRIYTQGNIPRIPYTDYREPKGKYVSRGRRLPLE